MLARPPHPFPARPLTAHKGTCGHVLVVAGSRGMSGAAFLAGKAALRAGAGLVTIACPESVNAVLEVKTTCVMTHPLAETAAGTLSEGALEPLRALVADKQAVALGPGLSQHPETIALVRALLAEWGEGPPVVVDADGLNAFAGQPSGLAALGERGVLTPHPGELRRLAGCDREALEQERAATLRSFVEGVPVVTLLKGRRTRVQAPGPDGPAYENQTGNPGMATAGAGDVLTGVIAALLAQGVAPFPAACLGAYVHGHAGDIAARRLGWAALIATDVLDALAEAIRPLEELT